MSSTRVVILFAAMRTGSTRVASVLAGFDKLYGRAEIFNPARAQSLEAECVDLGRFAGIDGVTASRDPRLIAWMRTNPNRAVDWLLERAEGRNLVFKLFPGHIADVGNRPASSSAPILPTSLFAAGRSTCTSHGKRPA